VNWLKSFFSGLVAALASFAGGFITGWRKKENSELKKEVKAHEQRDKIEDNIVKLSPSDKRLRLGKWVRGVQADPPDAA